MEKRKIDLERVISDPEYRRRIMRELNKRAKDKADEQLGIRTGRATGPRGTVAHRHHAKAQPSRARRTKK